MRVALRYKRFVEIEDDAPRQTLGDQLSCNYPSQFDIVGGVNLGLSIPDPLPFQLEVSSQDKPDS